MIRARIISLSAAKLHLRFFAARDGLTRAFFFFVFRFLVFWFHLHLVSSFISLSFASPFDFSAESLAHVSPRPLPHRPISPALVWSLFFCPDTSLHCVLLRASEFACSLSTISPSMHGIPSLIESVWKVQTLCTRCSTLFLILSFSSLHRWILLYWM